MLIECNWEKCIKCNPDCDLSLPYNEKLAIIRSKILDKSFILAEVEESLKIANSNDYSFYVGKDSYSLECLYNSLKMELRDLRIEEENIIQTLHRITK